MEYAKELFRAIAPYRKWWSSQASIQAGRDDQFLEAAARSGCKQLFLGLESISQPSMAEVHKGFNQVKEYAQIIKRIHVHGIAVQRGLFLALITTRRRYLRTLLIFWKKQESRMQRLTF